MSDIDQKEAMNEIYDSALVTAGVVVLSMASKKILGEKLTCTHASNVKDTVKLAFVVACTQCWLSGSSLKGIYLVTHSSQLECAPMVNPFKFV